MAAGHRPCRPGRPCRPPAENKQLHPRRKLRPYVPPSPGELLEATTASCAVPAASAAAAAGLQAAAAAAESSSAAQAFGSAGAAGVGASAGPSCPVATYWWGGLVKLQVLGCPPGTELVFYGPQALLVEASVEPADAPTLMASSYGSDSDSDGEGVAAAGRAAGTSAAAPAGGGGQMEEPHGFGAASVMRRGGLRPAKELRIKCSGGGGGGRGPGGMRQPLADIAVSGGPLVLP